MRSLRFVFALLACVLVAPVAHASLADLQNAIGVYTAVPTSLDDTGGLTEYEGATGLFPVYVVITQPHNDNTNGPIGRLGGFEFRLELPSSVMLLDATLPPLSNNFMNPPNFLVGTNIAVSGDAAVLLNLTLGEFAGTGGPITVGPVSANQSIAGAMAVADYEDDFSLSQAVPASGSFDRAVFCVFCRQYDEHKSWGAVKTLFH